MAKVLYYIVASGLWFILLTYFLRMFQQHSYRPDRFLRWLPPFVGLEPFKFKKKYKVKFVITPRVVRLAIASSLLAAAFFILLHPWGLLALLLVPYIMLGGNYIVTPIEKAINSHYYRDAQKKLREHGSLIVIGVTGSFGKTSTKNYLYRILSEKYNVLITPGNYNTLLGVVRTIREQLQPYHEVFIVEMGAKQIGDIKEICDLVHPTMGIVTAVGNMHLETFKTFANIQKTKFELIDSLPESGFGAINDDSPGIRSYKGLRARCAMKRYILPELSYTPSGTRFTYEGVEYCTPLLGKGNILDVVGALTIARELGVPERKMQIAVGKLQSVEHRLSKSTHGGITILDDAYNSNPDGAAMALDVLSKMECAGSRIVVTPGFVEMGEQQSRSAYNLGLEAAKAADVLIIVNELNRDSIRQGALAGGMKADSIICADNLDQAGACVRSLARPGDIVLYENDLPDTFK